MRYFNQKGERIGETEAANLVGINLNFPAEIIGWAIDVNNCEHGEYEEFIRLWLKIKPKALFANPETKQLQ